MTGTLIPSLLAVFPLLALFAQNQSEVELNLLWWPLFWCVAGASALYGVLLLVVKRPAGASLAASFVVVAFFYYGLFAERVSGWGVGRYPLLAVWLVLLGAGAVAASRTRRSLANVTIVLGVGAAALTLPQVLSITIYHANHASLAASDPRLWPTPLAAPSPSARTRRPDIYMIIPDDFARQDVLKRYLHYDDSGFLRQLRRRGFSISDQARSPYSDSESNTAAALNMDYLSAFPRVLGARSQDGRPVKRVIEDSRASRMLVSLGYRYVHLDTDDVTFAGGNPGISPFAPPDSFANLWLRKSVLQFLGAPFGFDDAARDTRYRHSITSVFAELAAQRTERRPKFVVFHTLLPHDPYVYDAQGRAVTFPGHGDQDLASATGRAYYVRQLRFLESKLLNTVDAIFAHATTPPVVVIQSDEGFQANPESFGEATMQDIRVKGLGAFFLPGHRRAGVPQPPNAVNALRFVFDEYLGTHYPMLPSRSYPERDLPYDFKPMRVK